ncbi:PEP/pyruvate-binding domain-containing protein [Nocardiopsis composta]
MTGTDVGGAPVVDLHEVRRDMGGLVGGKAANLGEMAAAGERVPPGFCVTTAAYAAGEVPAEAVAEAYARMGGGPVAVRSSATAEDLPDASFAGQQDTYLGVEGADAVVDAVRRCWASLDNERATAYREANEIDRAGVRMAVVVQRMVDAATAGVMFTADPITGSRARTVVDAVRGLGTAVVDGSTEPDHYVLDGDEGPGGAGGCLTAGQLKELGAAGRRLQGLFGAPQDAEWAYDADGLLWLLQSRPITTLFPLPPQGLPDSPRIYMEAGHLQGMLRPFTPMGMSMIQEVWGGWCAAVGVRIDPHEPGGLIADIGRRFYMDITPSCAAGRCARGWPRAWPSTGPGSGPPSTGCCATRASPPARPAVLRPHRPRPGDHPAPRRPGRRRLVPGPAGRRPGQSAGRHRGAAPAEGARGGAERRRVPGLGAGPRVRHHAGRGAERRARPGVRRDRRRDRPRRPAQGGGDAGGDRHRAGRHAAQRHHGDGPRPVADGGARQGAPRPLRPDAPGELAERHRRGELPDIGLDAFLDAYGHRTAAEIDIGVPRWRDDPAPVFGSIANYLRLDDPDQAPDRRFERAAAAAEAKLAELGARAVRARPVRGRLAVFLMRRSRSLTGMREYAKFAWLIPYAEMRRQLMRAGEDLAAAGVLETAEDIMFLELGEARAAARDRADRRDLVAQRRRTHLRELRRRSVPGLLLSDGTDVEATEPPPAATEGGFTGMPAAPGRAEGRARVVVDPVGAHVEPGEILVAPTTDPGWTPLFMTAAGLVSDTGSPIAHGPTVAREYGIPAVICIRDATTRIRTGDLLRIDGTAGTVQVVEEPEAERPGAEPAAPAAAD